mgnify:FL=1
MPYGIFLLFFITRVGFKWVSGFDNFELHADTLRYDQLSDNILQGNFNLDVVAFIVAPLYPYFLAFIKWGFGSQWEFWAVALQLSIVSLSGVYLYRLAILLFQKTRIALFAAFAYCFFFFTILLNFSFTH